jgi:F-type H+-transporting ATPase subunit b
MRQERQALVVLALLPFFVFASAEEGGGHTSVLADLLGKTLNFVLLFGGLAYVLRKPARAFLERAVESVRNTMAEASSSKEEAERELGSITTRLAGLSEEARKIQESGESRGQKDKSRILELAAREAEKLKAMAREEIEARAQASREELRRYAAELAVSQARSRIERRLTPELQARLIDESIDILGKQNAERSSR